MKKILFAVFLLLNVTNSIVFADCVTGYVCSIKDLNKNDTNSVIKTEAENKNKIYKEKNSKTTQIDKNDKKEKLNKTLSDE